MKCKYIYDVVVHDRRDAGNKITYKVLSTSANIVNAYSRVAGIALIRAKSRNGCHLHKEGDFLVTSVIYAGEIICDEG